jgi:AcrR family transcriptional regulator
MAGIDVAPMGSRQRKHYDMLAAARAIFLRSGYVSASMDEVAAVSQVSKQTVYKHFGSKESLFIEVVGSMTTAAGDGVHDANPASGACAPEDIPEYLAAYASRQLRAVLSPDVLQLRRLVIAESARFPDLGRELYERGPMRAIRSLTELFSALAHQNLLHIEDPAAAASQFNWLIMGEPLNRAMLLGNEGVPDDAAIDSHVHSTVRMFLAAYDAALDRGGSA